MYCIILYLTRRPSTYLPIYLHLHTYHYITSHHVTVHYSPLQYIAVHYSTLQYILAVHYSTVHYTTLQYIAVLYSTLQYITYIHNTYIYIHSLTSTGTVYMHDTMYVYMYSKYDSSQTCRWLMPREKNSRPDFQIFQEMCMRHHETSEIPWALLLLSSFNLVHHWQHVNTILRISEYRLIPRWQSHPHWSNRHSWWLKSLGFIEIPICRHTHISNT